MNQCVFDLEIGDSIQLGNCTLTLIDIENEIMIVRLDLDHEPYPIIGRFEQLRPR